MPAPRPDEQLHRHLPVLQYDSLGSYMADSPGIMTDRPRNLLKRADGTICAGGAEGPALTLAHLGWPRYADGTVAHRTDLIDSVGRDYVVQAREMHRGAYADRIHGRAVRAEDGGWWLQYWFFYLYNDKAFLGFGRHEGDWEMVQVRLDPGGRPAAMAFAQHGHGQRCDWAAVRKHGPRPVVYVARGSQASYATAGRHDAPIVPDYADGKGRLVVDSVLVDIGREPPGWLRWQGRWGSSRARAKVETTSPRGPAHQERWKHPGTFFAEAEEMRPLSELAPARRPPTPPAITARREGDRAVIAYRFAPAQAGPPPAVLLVALDSVGDELPPATQAHRLTAMHGEFEHLLPLTDGSYEVRVSVADESGTTSDPVVTRLDASTGPN